MAYQLIERPHRFSFSYNPARYRIQVTNPEAPGCALEVELYSIGINEKLNLIDWFLNPGILITRQTVYPAPDGTTDFYVDDYLNSFLEWEFPSLANDNILAVTGQIRQYYIRYRQITRSNTSPAWSSDLHNLRIMVKGGIAKEKFDRNNFFVNHLPQKRPFLTWRPKDHMIGTDERRYLTYLHTAGTEGPLTMVARVVYTDGVQEEVQKAFPSLEQSLLFHLPAGLQQLGLYALHPDKKVWYYDVLVKDGLGNELAAPYRLYADYDRYYNVFSFIYHNSLGGIDTVRVRGEYDTQINRDFTDIQMAIGETSGEFLPTENGVINISQHKSYTGDAGWCKTPAEQESLEDMLLSETVYRIVGARWLKVLHLQKSQPMGASDDTKWSFPLQWRYTFDNSRFTPSGADFGAGINDEAPGPVYGTCTAPSGLAAEYIGDTADGKEFHFSWNGVGGAEGYELEYQVPGNTDWTRVATAVPEATLYFTAAGDYSWRVRTQCAPGDFSGYASGPGFTIEDAAPTCTAPSDLVIILLSMEVANAMVSLKWQHAASRDGYVVEWREVGASVWNSADHGGSRNYHMLYVDKNIQYEWRVRTKCVGGGYSPWTYGPNFIASNMVGSCNPPSGLSVVEISNMQNVWKTLLFTWNNVAGNSGYEFQTREKGTVSWVIWHDLNSNENVQSPLAVMFGTGKTFEWRLRSRCTGGGFSNFVNGPDFNT